MEGTNYRNMSYSEEAAKDNSIFTMWTKKWGIHVRPWYSMDKLKFSFVDVGAKGKGDSFDIYMDIVKYGFPCFRKWSNDILGSSRRFERIMADEAKNGEKYPNYYKYVTGEKGDKSVGICNSSKGGNYVINASITRNGKKIFANIPIEFGDLQLLAENFERTYADRQRVLDDYRAQAELETSSHYKDTDAVKGKAVVEDAHIEVTQESFEKTKEPAKDVKPGATEPVPMRISLTGLPQKLDGEFLFKGIDKGNGKEVDLYVPNAVLAGEQKDRWKSLHDKLQNGKISITFLVYNRSGKMEIDKIA
jgi:hypothetical protein